MTVIIKTVPLLSNLVFSNNGGYQSLDRRLGLTRISKGDFFFFIKITVLKFWVRMTDLNTSTTFSKNLTLTAKDLSKAKPRNNGENGSRQQQ